MKLLLIGDVVGKPGRSALLDRLQDLQEQHAIDFTVMNAENVAGGFSITAAIAELLFSSGIDVMTSGNHIFDKHEVIDYIQKQPRLLRPANYPPHTPGNGMWVGEARGVRIAVISLLGRVFMQPADDPFRIVNELVTSLPAEVKVGSWICTPKPRLKRPRWVGISMAGPVPSTELIPTFRPPTSGYCTKERRSLPTWE